MQENLSKLSESMHELTSSIKDLTSGLNGRLGKIRHDSIKNRNANNKQLFNNFINNKRRNKRKWD